jgi:hypothetical protein
LLGKDWDPIETPKRVQNIINMSVSADKNAEIHKSAIDAYLKGDTERGIAGYLSTTTNDEQRQRVLADAAKMLPLEGREATLAKFQTPWSEDNVKKWADMALTPEQRAVKQRAEDSAKATATYRADQLELGKRRVAVQEENAKKERATSLASQRDEQTFPGAVRQYVANIIDRYRTQGPIQNAKNETITPQQATEDEISKAMSKLLAAHPKMDPAKVWKMVDDTFGGKATFMGQTPKRGSDVSAPATGSTDTAKTSDLRARVKALLHNNNKDESDTAIDIFLKNPANVKAIGGQ